MPGLQLTGERTLPGIAHENYWFTRHVAAYLVARGRARGLRVVDAGCGEGYGSALLAQTAERVVGVDLAADVVEHARTSYPHITFLAAELGAVPLPDAGFDLVVSLQVIEHVWDVPAVLAEAARLLAPGGVLLCATPNRLTSTPGNASGAGEAGNASGAGEAGNASGAGEAGNASGADEPLNPFHVREFTADELRDAIAPHLRVDAVLGVHHGSRLRLVERVIRRHLPDVLVERPAEERPPWLRAVVAATRPSDFVVRAHHLDASLDLLAVATKR